MFWRKTRPSCAGSLPLSVTTYYQGYTTNLLIVKPIIAFLQTLANALYEVSYLTSHAFLSLIAILHTSLQHFSLFLYIRPCMNFNILTETSCVIAAFSVSNNSFLSPSSSKSCSRRFQFSVTSLSLSRGFVLFINAFQ